MFTWMRSQFKEHGAIHAAKIISRAAWLKMKGALLDALLPKRVECPCCGWRGRSFRKYIESNIEREGVECPVCYSHPRHRSLFLWLKSNSVNERRGRALLFAPEKALEPVWREAKNLRRIRIDIEAVRGAHVLGDIQRLPLLSDSIDLIWCHHVLMLVEDDRAAMSELHRVLKPRAGELFLSVAETKEAATEEFGHRREDLLGFRRIYGADFAEKLRVVGFDVKSFRAELSPQQYERYGVSPEELFYLCTKS